MLLFVGASWSVDGEVVLSSDNPIVDHVGLRRIFVAGPDDHLPSRIVDLGPDWSIDSMNLTLNAGVVSSEPGEGVHVRPDLPERPKGAVWSGAGLARAPSTMRMLPRGRGDR
jgi:hypothetical protein